MEKPRETSPRPLNAALPNTLLPASDDREDAPENSSRNSRKHKATSPPERARLVLSRCVDGTMQQVRYEHQHIVAALSTLKMPAQVRHRIEVVLAETMNNIVEHAFRRVPTAAFSIRIEQIQNTLRFVFEDNGRPMPHLVAPPGCPPDIDVDLADLPEGGFGWVLIRNLTDSLEYRRSGDTNILEFSIGIGVST